MTQKQDISIRNLLRSSPLFIILVILAAVILLLLALKLLGWSGAPQAEWFNPPASSPDVLAATVTPLAAAGPTGAPAASLPPAEPTLNAIQTNPPAQPTSSPWSTLAPLPAGWQRLVTNGDRTTNQVALTFDVCQAEGDLSGYDAEIVRILNEMGAPATFFLGGQWVRDHLPQARELAQNPLFELGNHSWSHRDFAQLTPQQIEMEVLLAQKIMWEMLGQQPILFRFPFGTYSDSALLEVANLGLYSIQWDVVSGDPDENVLSGPMTDWVLAQVQPGSIVIMHANGRGWHTAEALPNIIQSLRTQGYQLVTITQLLGLR